MKIQNLLRNHTKIIDNQGRLFGKYDLFVPLFLLILLVLGFFVTRVLLQKDTYITVELFASGGEWWWNNPQPPYWLTDPIQPGAKEFDAQGNVLAEVLDVRKFESGERKMLWIKAKLKVTPANKAKQYRFRREPIQIGSLVYIAPNNIKIYTNVMWVEGTPETRTEEQHIVTLKEYDVIPWHADAIKVGDTMKDDDGKVLVEVLEKNSVPAEMITTDDRGNVLVRSNPLRRDITLKLKMTTVKSRNRNYFSYFQPIKIGFYIWIPFENTNFSGNILAID